MDIKDKIQLIRETPIENMDEQFIMDLGLNDEFLNEQPSELKEHFGKGLKIWQYPIQISPFIRDLNGVCCKSYLEIGVRHGGTFILMSELLAKTNPNIITYACDIIPMSDTLREYRKHRNFIYLQMSSTSNEFKSFCENNYIDFAFIDGDHSYDVVLQDYKMFKNKLDTKHIVLHDIKSSSCQYTGEVWNQVKYDPGHIWREYTMQYESVEKNFMGIGYLYKY
jgi:cephalosporin hydroxylase